MNCKKHVAWFKAGSKKISVLDHLLASNLLGTSQCGHCVLSESASWCIPRLWPMVPKTLAPFGNFNSWNGTGRWAPSSKWSFNPDKSPYKQVTGAITPISGVRTWLITGRDPPCTNGAIWAYPSRSKEWFPMSTESIFFQNQRKSMAYQSVETNDQRHSAESTSPQSWRSVHICVPWSSVCKMVRMVILLFGCTQLMTTWPFLVVYDIPFIHHHHQHIFQLPSIPRFPLCISVGIPIAACLQATHVLRLVMKSWSNHGKSASLRKLWKWYEHVPKICVNMLLLYLYILRLWWKTDWGCVRIHWSGCMS